MADEMTRENRDNAVRAGVFETVEEAEAAVRALLRAGFSHDEISVMCSDQGKERHFQSFEHQEPAGTYTLFAAMSGGTIGAAVTTLGMAVTATAVGSITLLAIAPITVVAGGIVGGLVGAMMTRGVEKELADFYDQALEDGNILVAVERSVSDVDRLDVAMRVLADAGAAPLSLPEG